MKRILIIIVAIAALGSCKYKSGSGNVVTDKRNTGPFTAISVSGGFEVELKSGPTEVTVEADDNILKYVQTEVVNGNLKIRLDDINVHDAHLKVYISSPEINEINSSSSAEVVIQGMLKSDKTIELESSSGSEIKASLDAPAVAANASSGGELNLSGHTRNFKATSSSGSSINANELLSENTTVNVSSGASAKVHASISLDANASSGGNVSYRGAANVKKSVSSGGEVDKE